MLEMFLGQDRFRAGVSHYLTKHSYANTETNDLWDAIEETVNADGRGNVPVRALMDSWIWQPGYPLVSADIENGALVLRQNRFAFDETNDPTVWLVPVHLRNGNNETKVLLDKPAARITLADPNAPVIVNAGGHGYYRVAYSPALLARLNATTIAGMSTIERYNLVDDAWNAVVAGRLGTPDFLNFLDGFAAERELAVWQAIAIGLRGLERLLPGHQQHLLQRKISALVAPALDAIGWQPTANEDDLTGKLRGLLIVLLACDAGDPDAQHTARTFFAASEAGQQVHPEVVAAATTVVASTGGQAEFDMFVDKFKRAESPQDQMRALYALADFQSADLIERACNFAFSGEVKTQNAPFLLNRCIANREFGTVAWRIVRQRWTEANEKFPVNTIVRMVDTTKTLNTPELLADVQAFFAEHAIPQAAKTLEQVLERQRVNTALRSREGQTLLDTLSR
jgi:puromycin-sensitive aminopeptidase